MKQTLGGTLPILLKNKVCFFRNEPTEDFSEIPAFRIKSNWSPTKGHPVLEMFLNQME